MCNLHGKLMSEQKLFSSFSVVQNSKSLNLIGYRMRTSSQDFPIHTLDMDRSKIFQPWQLYKLFAANLQSFCLVLSTAPRCRP